MHTMLLFVILALSFVALAEPNKPIQRGGLKRLPPSPVPTAFLAKFLEAEELECFGDEAPLPYCAAHLETLAVLVERRIQCVKDLSIIRRV